jgi:hypothetical protein
MFLAFLWRTLRGAELRLVLMLVPALLYTVAHQGLRFNSLWVLLALFIALKQERAPAPRRRVLGSMGAS